MGLTHRAWEDATDEQMMAWGNVWTLIEGPRAGYAGETVDIVWEGWCTGWQETERGSLELRRRVELDDEGRSTAFTFHQIAAGRWHSVGIDSYVFDMEAILEREAEQQAAAEEQQRQQEAFEAQQREAAIAQGVPLAPRALRRQPPR